jgi:uncharacterized protein (DUF736 family)
MSDEQKQDDRLGALWSKHSAKGEYFTGNIEINGEKIGVVVFSNDKKGNDKAPDWRILRAKKREEKPQHIPSGEPSPMSDSDIPF